MNPEIPNARLRTGHPVRARLLRVGAALLVASVWIPALAGKVTGRVADKAGAPLAGVSVTLIPNDPARASRQTLKTNKDGRYLFGIVPDGVWGVEVMHEDLVPLTIKLTVFDAAEQKNVVDYAGPFPAKLRTFDVGINKTVTFDFMLVPKSETPQAIAEKRQKEINEIPVLLGEGKYQEALSRIDDGLTVRPDSPDLHYLRSFALFRLNDLDGARAAALKALELRPDQPGAHFVIAGVLLAQEKKEESLAQFEAELANPATDEETKTRALLSAGELHRELGHAEAAIAAFEKVTQADPRMAEAWNALSELYMKTGQHDKATAAAAQARSVGVEDPVIVFNLGAESWNRKDYAKAADYFRHATELDPNFALAWKNLGYACVNLGNTEEAQKAFKTYLELSPAAKDAGEVREMLAAISKG